MSIVIPYFTFEADVVLLAGAAVGAAAAGIAVQREEQEQEQVRLFMLTENGQISESSSTRTSMQRHSK